MTRTKFQIAQRQTKKVEVHKNWNILNKEHAVTLFRGKEELKYCREYYRDGVGVRNLAKLIEANWNMGDDMEVVGYSEDCQGKVLRIFANKYDTLDGDDVSESILWESITIGQPSKLKYSNEEFYYS